MALSSGKAANMKQDQQSKHLDAPSDESFDSLETVECSFISADEEDNLTVSLVPDDDEQGLEIPLSGNKYWAPKLNPLVVTKADPGAPLLEPDEQNCVEMILKGDEDERANVTLSLTNATLQGHVPPPDSIDHTGIEKMLIGSRQGRQISKNDKGDEGVEMNLNDFEQEARLILLDLQGAEVATTGKKVRFMLEGEDDANKISATQRRRRKKLTKFLRNKTKKSMRTTSVGCPPLAQMNIQVEASSSVVEADKETPPVQGTRERVVSMKM